MTCSRCEDISQPEKGPRNLYFWPPGGHSAEKVRAVLTSLGAAPAQPGAVWPLVLSLEIDQFETVTTPVWRELTPREQEDTKVVLVPKAGRPTLEDYPRVSSLLALRRRLKAAWVRDLLADGRLISFFQPIVRLGEGPEAMTVVAHEALSRGLTPEGGLLSGGAVVQAVTDADLLFQFDRAARLSAVESFGRGGFDGRLFVNFLPTAIYDPAFCLRTTIGRIRKLGLAPERIVFEVVESEQHRNLDHLEHILTFYRSQGFSVALDDFGAGYSNYEVLERLRPDIVKIDMGLVRNVDTVPFKAAILTGVIDLCQRFGITTLAEGIETDAELDWVRRHGIDLGQGYRLGRPARAETLHPA